MERINVKPKLSVRQITMIGMLSAISIFLRSNRLRFYSYPTCKSYNYAHSSDNWCNCWRPNCRCLCWISFRIIFNVSRTHYNATNRIYVFKSHNCNSTKNFNWNFSILFYVFFKNKFNKPGISIGIASLCATLVNTIGVLGLTYIIYAERFANVIGVDPSTIGYVILFTIGIPNGIPEAIVSMLLCIPIILTVLKIKK